MTNEINPNRGGPNCSDIDTQSLRFPVRGRSDHDSSGSYRDRLRDQVENGKETYKWWPTPKVLDDMARHCDDNMRLLMETGSTGSWEEFGG